MAQIYVLGPGNSTKRQQRAKSKECEGKRRVEKYMVVGGGDDDGVVEGEELGMYGLLGVDGLVS